MPQHIRPLVNATCLLMFAFSATAARSDAEQKQRLPNIIMIMADDVSWEAFGCYGGEDYQTPNIDQLASDGIRFAHCYSTPICTTSRVKLMTGQYNFRNYTHFGYLNPKEKTFGNMLQQAGYKTAIAGKWQLNGLYNPDVFKDNQDKTRPYQAGFDEYCLWQLTQGKQAGERFWDPPLETNGKMTTAEENRGKYGPDIMSDFLCDFMVRNQEQPFFVYYPMVLVHDPFLPTPDSYKPGMKKKGKMNKVETKANFVAMVAYMDKIVGKIVKQVEEIGQLENTIILFTGDNGTNRNITSRWQGQDIQGGKAGTTDMGNHVPLVAYWKGHTPPGVVLDDLIDFTDFYTTFADVAGVTMGASDPIDGISFLPQLKGKTGPTRQWSLNHYQPYWANAWGQFARDQNYKLYRDGRFYHVPVDLKEETDLSESKRGDTAEASRQRLQTLLDLLPPAPQEKGTRNTKIRPIYPFTANLIERGD